MDRGILYGVGIGPGDPELLTLKALNILNHEKIIFVPQAQTKEESLALEIVKSRISEADKKIVSVKYPMSRDKRVLQKHWNKLAAQILEYLNRGENVVYITLGDPSIYSTYGHLVRSLKAKQRNITIRTVPGVSSYSLAAGLVNIPLAEQDEMLVVYPASSGLEELASVLDSFTNIVIMKIGRRLPGIIELLREKDLLEHTVFIKRGGLAGQQIEHDLLKLPETGEALGNLSIILVKGRHR